MNHFIAICDFQLGLKSWNTQFGFKSSIFRPVCPRNLTDDLEKTIGLLFYATSNFVHTFVAICKFKLELQSGNTRFFCLCDLEIWWMTSKNNRVSLLCHFKLCASFRNHLWIQTGVTVRKCSIQVTIVDFSSHVTSKFDGWPKKSIEHISFTISRFMYHFGAIGEFKLELQPGNS